MRKRICRMLFLCSALQVLAACGGGAETPSQITPSLGDFALPERTFGDPAFVLAPPASNSAGVFSFRSSDASVAVVSNSLLTITGAGTAVITASQDPWGNFSGASKSTVFIVKQAIPTLSNFLPITKTYGDSSFSIPSPSSNSQGSFSFHSDNPAVASIASDVVTIVGAGSAQITAIQAAAGNFTAGSISTTITISAATPVLSAFSIPRQTYGVLPFIPRLPVSNSPGAITYSSSDSRVARINENSGELTITGVGSATIIANQAAAGNFLASSVSATLVVDAALPTFGPFPSISKSWGDPAFFLVPPTSNSSGAFTFSVAPGQSEFVSIAGDKVTLLSAPGEVSVIATQAAAGNYAEASVSATLTITSNLPQGFTASGGVTRSPISKSQFVWSSADSYCAAANFLGVSGWRLLGRAEIRKEGAYFGDQVFVWLREPGDVPGTYWFTGYSNVFPSGFRNGFVDGNSNSLYAVCVR